MSSTKPTRESNLASLLGTPDPPAPLPEPYVETLAEREVRLERQGNALVDAIAQALPEDEALNLKVLERDVAEKEQQFELADKVFRQAELSRQSASNALDLARRALMDARDPMESEAQANAEYIRRQVEDRANAAQSQAIRLAALERSELLTPEEKAVLRRTSNVSPATAAIQHRKALEKRAAAFGTRR